MVARAYGHTLQIQQRGHVAGLGAFQQKRDHRLLLRRFAENTQARHFAQAFGGVGQQLLFPRVDRRETQRIVIIDGRTQTHEAGDIRRTGLELVRHVGEGGAAETHFANHVATAEERRHRLQVFALRPQRAGAGGAEHLVPGERVEIAAQRLHVDRPVRHRLRAIDQQRDAAPAAFACDLAHRVDRAQHVGDMGDAGELHLRRQQLDILLHDQLATLVDRRGLHRGATTRGDQLPRHDVGVVLHHRGQDAVARLQLRQHMAVGDQVGGLGGAGGEDDLIARTGMDEPRQLVARAFVSRRGLLAQLMHRARHVGVVLAIVRVHRRDHRLRLLAGVGTVEIDQRLAVYRARQQREVRADALDVEGGGRAGCGVHR